MKRRLLTIAIFVLAGVVVNVGVAWGHKVWNCYRVQDRVAKVMKQRVKVDGLVHYSEQYYERFRQEEHVYGVGWPAHSLGTTWTFIDLWAEPCFRPLWPGFAINTLFYATLLWLLIPGPFALRRFIRRKRAQCPACGYPAGESAVCSECGRALPQGRRRAWTTAG